MNHLSPQQIDGWLIGERSPEVEGHLQSCSACADEVARVTGPLMLFGAAVRSWGEDQMGPVRAPRADTRPPIRWWQAALALAMLLLLIAAPVYRRRQVAYDAARDEMLLRQVDQEISRSVPAPMEPLAKLMPNDFTR